MILNVLPGKTCTGAKVKVRNQEGNLPLAICFNLFQMALYAIYTVR
jgi:hypothetical protein